MAPAALAASIVGALCTFPAYLLGPWRVYAVPPYPFTSNLKSVATDDAGRTGDLCQPAVVIAAPAPRSPLLALGGVPVRPACPLELPIAGFARRVRRLARRRHPPVLGRFGGSVSGPRHVSALP